jgi:hypothetical protein
MRYLICYSYVTIRHCSYFELFVARISDGRGVNQQLNSSFGTMHKPFGALNGMGIVEDNEPVDTEIW